MRKVFFFFFLHVLLLLSRVQIKASVMVLELMLKGIVHKCSTTAAGAMIGTSIVIIAVIRSSSLLHKLIVPNPKFRNPQRLCTCFCKRYSVLHYNKSHICGSNILLCRLLNSVFLIILIEFYFYFCTNMLMTG